MHELPGVVSTTDITCILPYNAQRHIGAMTVFLLYTLLLEEVTLTARIAAGRVYSIRPSIILLWFKPSLQVHLNTGIT